MDLNPLIGVCAEIQRQLTALQQSHKQAAGELKWYSNIDPRALTENLRRYANTTEKLRLQIQVLNEEIQDNKGRSRETESAIVAITSTHTEIQSHIDRLQQSEKQVAGELQWFYSIDPRALTDDLQRNEGFSEQLHLEIQSLEKEFQENTARLDEIEPAIGAILYTWNWFKRRQIDLRRRRVQLRGIGSEIAAQKQAKANEREQAITRIATITSDLQRHRTFDAVRGQADLDELIEAIAAKKEGLAIAGDHLRRDRETLARLLEIGKQKAAKRQSNVLELENALPRITEDESSLQRHRAFDLPRRQRDAQQLAQDIACKEEELAVALGRKRRVDEILSPLVQEMQNLETRRRCAHSDLEGAEGLDRRLSSAGNSYERAMIHEECERSFGTGNPRKIIGERQREVRQLDRDYDKARRRVQEVARMAARRIDTVVIDGNNLCYEGNRFIGLASVEALVPLISRMCVVVVVFDSAIRRLMNTDDSSLQRRLGSHAKVHVVASRRMADETVLDLANRSEFTYVLSNDRFGDFNEKSAVKGGRVIRHEIVNGNVFVHDLQLRAAYQ